MANERPAPAAELGASYSFGRLENRLAAIVMAYLGSRQATHAIEVPLGTVWSTGRFSSAWAAAMAACSSFSADWNWSRSHISDLWPKFHA